MAYCYKHLSLVQVSIDRLGQPCQLGLGLATLAPGRGFG